MLECQVCRSTICGQLHIWASVLESHYCSCNKSHFIYRNQSKQHSSDMLIGFVRSETKKLESVMALDESRRLIVYCCCKPSQVEILIREKCTVRTLCNS